MIRRGVRWLMLVGYAVVMAASGPHAHARGDAEHGNRPHVHIGWWLPAWVGATHAAAAGHAHHHAAHHHTPQEGAPGPSSTSAAPEGPMPAGPCCDCVPLPDLASRAAGDVAPDRSGGADDGDLRGVADGPAGCLLAADGRAVAGPRAGRPLDPPAASHRLLLVLRNLRL